MSRLSAATLLIVALISAHTVLAHFQLTYPASRGFDETKEPTAPCGGFDSIGSRVQVPLKNAFVEINSEHTSYTYTVSVLVNNSPVVADFSTSNLTQVATGSRNYPESACLPMDLSKNTAIKDGANATIQVVFNGGDGSLYQCTDVTFVNAASMFNQSMCINADGSNAFGSSASASSAVSASGSAASPSATKAGSMASSLTATHGVVLAVAMCVALMMI